MMRAAIACTAILMIFGAAACGGDDDSGGPPVIPIPDTGDPDATGDTHGDTGETDTVDPDGVGPADGDAGDAGDAGDGDGGCETDDECEGEIDLEMCEEAVCQNGECVAVEYDLCCFFTSDCIGLLEPGDCQQLSCVEQRCELIDLENCCKTDNDCADLADGCCTKATCGGDGLCDVQVEEYCCETSEDCDDGNPITTDQCVETCVEDGCKNLAGPCDLQAVFLTKDFDDGTLQLLTVFDDDPGDNVSVSAVKHGSVSPGWSAYFGDPACKTYYDGPMDGCEPVKKTADESQSVQLKLTTEQFQMDPEAGAFLGFWVNMSAEPELFIPSIGYWSPDYLRVVVDDGSQTYEVWKSTDEDAVGGLNTTYGEWLFQVADLSPFSNKAIEVTFEFVADDTGNYNINAGVSPDEVPWTGAYIDSVRIMAICEQGTCDADNPSCPDDFNGCTAQSCTLFTQGSGGVCAYESATPGESCQGCSQVGDCGNDACFDYACVDSVCNATKKPECCAPSSSFPEATAEPNIAYEGFEGADALSGWEIEDPYADNVSWQVSGVYPYQGASSLYFGNGIDFEADPPNPSKASVWTPWFEVDADPFRTPVLSFWLYMDTEYTNATSAINCELGFDQLMIYVATKDGQMVEVWNSCNGTGDEDESDDMGNSTLYLYEQAGVDLSAYGGEEIRLGFTFDSGEGLPGVAGVGNTGEGVFIDDLTVSSICGDDPCVSSSDCDDDEPCTDDVCDLGECINTQDNPLCCTDASDCDDGNDCTEESCVNALCTSNYQDPPPGADDGLIACCSESAWLGGWSEDFEGGGLGGFTDDSDTSDVFWHASTATANSGNGSANFADPTTGTYALPAGGSTTGRLISPPIDVPPYGLGNSYAQFWFAMSTEWNENTQQDWEALDFNGDGIPEFVSDELQVMVMVNGLMGLAESHWASWYVTNSTQGAWVKSRVDLADYAGETIQLVFEFASDAPNNDFPGVFIDDVSFGTTCLPSGAVNCIYGGDCSTSDACKEAICSETFKCLEEPKATPECCEPYEVEGMTIGMEGAGDGWTFDGDCGDGNTAPAVVIDESSFWSLATEDDMPMAVKVEEQSLYFGNGVDYGGSTSSASCGNALSPPVTLEAGVPWTLDFWAYIDVETHETCGTSPYFTDVFTIEAVDVDTGDSEVIYTKPGNYQDEGGSNDCSKYNKWYKPTIVLDDWAGKTFQFRFHFHTYDGESNNGKGIAIDDMVFTKGCAPVP